MTHVTGLFIMCLEKASWGTPMTPPIKVHFHTALKVKLREEGLSELVKTLHYKKLPKSGILALLATAEDYLF